MMFNYLSWPHDIVLIAMHQMYSNIKSLNHSHLPIRRVEYRETSLAPVTMDFEETLSNLLNQDSFISDAALPVLPILEDTKSQPLRQGRRGRRAAIACLACRTRKVRCDVSSRKHGPCANCEWSKVECNINWQRRRHKQAVLSFQVTRSI